METGAKYGVCDLSGVHVHSCVQKYLVYGYERRHAHYCGCMFHLCIGLCVCERSEAYPTIISLFCLCAKICDLVFFEGRMFLKMWSFAYSFIYAWSQTFEKRFELLNSFFIHQNVHLSIPYSCIIKQNSNRKKCANWNLQFCRDCKKQIIRFYPAVNFQFLY